MSLGSDFNGSSLIIQPIERFQNFPIEPLKNLRPSIPAYLPEIGFLEAIQNPEYSKHCYMINDRSLYLTDENTCIFKVDWFQGYNSREAEIFKDYTEFTVLINRLANITSHTTLYHCKKIFHSDISLRQALEDCIEQTCVEGKFEYAYFLNAYGIPKGLIDNNPVLKMLDRTVKFFEVSYLCQSHWEGNDGGIVREIMSVMLKKQEEAILSEMPLNLPPERLHTMLIELLAKKGLTREEAIDQFNYKQKRDKNEAVVGSFVIVKLLAQIEAWKALKIKCDTKGSKVIPFGEIWRFFIDEDHENKGAYIFENEPFYILSSFSGFEIILKSDREMCMDEYLYFAKGLTQNPPVLHQNTFLEKEDVDKCESAFFKITPSAGGPYSIEGLKQDQIGLRDLEDRSNAKDIKAQAIRGGLELSDEAYWIANSTGFNFSGNSIKGVNETNPEIVFQRIFLGREQMLQKAKTPGERLIAYIWAARELEISHRLPDGNGRTSIISLVKWIAEDPDLPVYMPGDPNILDVQSPEAIIHNVYNGMRRFQELADEDPGNLISINELLDQADVKGALWDKVHQRAQLPEEVITKLVAEDKARIRQPK